MPPRQWFHSEDGLYFLRRPDGSVCLEKTEGPPSWEGGHVLFAQTLPAGSWVSAVLSMTAFGERAGDWHIFMPHHEGGSDILAASKTAGT